LYFEIIKLLFGSTYLQNVIASKSYKVSYPNFIFKFIENAFEPKFYLTYNRNHDTLLDSSQGLGDKPPKASNRKKVVRKTWGTFLNFTHWGNMGVGILRWGLEQNDKYTCISQTSHIHKLDNEGH
jgi:hypothetical protein